MNTELFYLIFWNNYIKPIVVKNRETCALPNDFDNFWETKNGRKQYRNVINKDINKDNKIMFYSVYKNYDLV